MSEIIPYEYNTTEIATDWVRMARRISRTIFGGECLMSDPVLNAFREDSVSKIMELFHQEAVIIFGSRTFGNAHKDSDLDIILISEQFEHVPQHHCLPLVFKRVSGLHFPLITYITRRMRLNG